MAVKQYRNTGYSLGQGPLSDIFPSPIVSTRNPGTSDFAPLGQQWVNKSTNSVYFVSSVANNAANWVSVAGGAGVFSSLTVSGNITSTAGNVSATAGSLSAGTTVTAGTGITATTGNIVASAGNINATLGSMSSGTTITAGTALIATTSVTAGTSITATLGNITATNGNLVLSTAATFLQLPGPVTIQSGAGAPAGGLALHVGDMYINTTAASAVTRLYIATAAGVWTNVTCAA